MKPDWAEALAEEVVQLCHDTPREDRPLLVGLIATKFRTMKARAQSEAILAAQETMKKVFNEHGIGGGDK